MITLDDFEEYGKRYENYIAMCCPFHEDTHPSLFVYEDAFRCVACGKFGKLDTLLAKLKGVPPPRKQFTRLPWYRWLEGKTIRGFCLGTHENLVRFPAQGSYLRKRKIDHLIPRLKIGWIEGYYSFPIFNSERRIVGVVMRCGEANQEATNDRYFTPPGQEPQLFVPSWKRVLQADYIYVVYGIIDSLVLYSLGEPVVTWSIGKNLPAEALSEFRKRIIVVPDLGEEKDAFRLVMNLGWRGITKFLKYPDGMKDPADIYTRAGAEALQVALG